MNLLDSHDTARALTTVGGNKKLLKLMAVMQFTWPGLPTVYYGDEAGMEGGGDPDCRRTYPWGSEDKSLIAFYSMLARLRREHPALSTGDYINLGYDNAKDAYVYARKDSAGVAVVGVSRNKDAQEIEVPVSGAIGDGTTLTDVLTGSGEYRVEGGKLKLSVPGESAVLLMPK
jgi:glycosidase